MPPLLKLTEENMSKPQTVNKILITGGGGYIGNTLISSLPESVDIVVVDNFHTTTLHKRRTNEALKKLGRITLIDSNVANVGKYKKFLKDIDVVIYMASLNSYRESNSNPQLYLKENNTNLQTFLDALKQYSPNVKKIILTSSRGVYGEGPYKCAKCRSQIYPLLAEKLVCTVCSSNDITPQKIKETDIAVPTSYYGVTKKIQEDLINMYCQQENILLDVFRIFNVYGENQGKYYSNIGIIPQIYGQIKNKREMYLSGNGELARDFVYVADVVKVLKDAIYSKNTRKNRAEIYNLGSGRAVSINDIARFFEDSGYKFKKKKLGVYNDIKYSVADNSKVSKVFDIKTFSDMYDFLSNVYKKV